VRIRAGSLAFLGGLAMLSRLHAGNAPVDEGLLEFLGSVDSEDKGWHEYLASTDIDKVARRTAGARVNPVASAPPPPRPVATSSPAAAAVPAAQAPAAQPPAAQAPAQVPRTPANAGPAPADPQVGRQ